MGQYSKEAGDISKLKLLLDTIEAYIFSIPGLNDEYELPGRAYVKRGEDASPEWQQYQLEELQGAYLMVILQHWTGNRIARMRVRQQRFTRVVAVRPCPLYHPPILNLFLLDFPPPRPPSHPTQPLLSNNRPTLIPHLDPARILHPPHNRGYHARQLFRHLPQRLSTLPMVRARRPLPNRRSLLPPRKLRRYACFANDPCEED